MRHDYLKYSKRKLISTSRNYIKRQVISRTLIVVVQKETITGTRAALRTWMDEQRDQMTTNRYSCCHGQNPLERDLYLQLLARCCAWQRRKQSITSSVEIDSERDILHILFSVFLFYFTVFLYVLLLFTY